MTEGEDALRLAGGIVAGTGGFLLLIGVALILRAVTFLRHAVAAEGTVVEFVESRDIDTGSISYAPVVRFSAADGRTVQFQDPTSTSPNPYEVGDTVPVKYKPSNPQKARIPTIGRLWVAPGILVVLGAALVAGGIVLRQSA